ncbi:MAG: SRPBCC domain-containing protein [Flavobacteriales bacterium]|nr:SRPBCC domain-containing protein [Flavobacteriales bacterium]
MEATSKLVGDRGIEITRVVKAPRALVWMACTEPKHIDQWWGPNGFANKTIAHDLRVGGVWKYTMTGPDGKVWPNLITYTEVTPMDRLAYDHGDWENPKMFTGSLSFTDVEGGTLVTLHNVFQSKDVRDQAIENYGAAEGGKQTLTRLSEYVQKQPTR